ncbi:YhcN/YlaJ family sporulation lipoprotein [Bacillus sp. USDA818B3_A]|uniref:YhcN/YlaJ family sporulation lipoprotein n=1 Tax=Bacillus sp. USDA818B3_A TaxID=2698834 RepID=UPI001368F8CE|nr:YhcN/YlaJ family sporulation lipoprotein [Bacillus sp. USDA818B3_A]
MNQRSLVIVSFLICFYFTGCSKNNANDDIANQNRILNNTEPTKVNYNTPNHGGPAITGVDTSDPELDKNRNKRNNLPAAPRKTYDSSMIIAASRAEKYVKDLSEINDANIIVTDNNAFIAVKMEASYSLTSKLKNKITRAAKSADSNIDNVYISEDAEFFNQMNRFSRVISNGKTSSGFIDEFSDTIRRVFPDAR